jgi:hypothetical protein
LHGRCQEKVDPTLCQFGRPMAQLQD